MKCPYCISDISDEALACPHCARDLYLFKPLLEKIAALEERFKAQPDPDALLARIKELETRLEEATHAAPAAEAADAAPRPPMARLIEWASLWAIPLALLLVAHGLITVVYDLNTLYLRVVSLLIPLPFGFTLMARGRHSFVATLAAAFGMALLAVLGMSWVTGLVDHTPVLPQGMREWREFIEYAASVGFSYMTGMLLGRMLWRRRQAARSRGVQGLALKLAKLVSNPQETADKLQATAKKLSELGGSLSAAGASVAAAYTGLQGFLGQ